MATQVQQQPGEGGAPDTFEGSALAESRDHQGLGNAADDADKYNRQDHAPPHGIDQLEYGGGHLINPGYASTPSERQEQAVADNHQTGRTP